MKLHLPLALLTAFLTPIAASAAVSPSDTTLSISPAEVQDYLDALAGGNLTISGKNTVHFHDHTNKSGNGGIFYMKAGTTTALNLTNNASLLFTNNRSTIGTGGVAAFYNVVQTDISGNDFVSFTSNSAKTYGGAYYANNSTSTLSIKKNTQVDFLDNESDGGGAIYIANATFEDNDLTTFSGNRSTTNGGAMIISSKATFTSTADRADTVRFSNNYAKTYGGVIELKSKAQVSFSGLEQFLVVQTVAETCADDTIANIP